MEYGSIWEIKKKYDYFWEIKWPMALFFAHVCFPNTYKRKFSMTGNGIYDLVIVKDRIFELKITEQKQIQSLGEGNNKLTRDPLKNAIINQICNKLNGKYVLNDGKIYIKVQKWFARIDVIEKRVMPT